MNTLNWAGQQQAQNYVPALRSMDLLRIKPIVRDFAQQHRKQLPRDSAPNRSLIDKVSTFNIFRAVHKRSTKFVKDLLHRSEGMTVSRVVRRCQPAVYRVWIKCMTDTYPTQAYLMRVGLTKSRVCPYCPAGAPETLTHFACVCPQFREARTSAHNQVRQVISALLSRYVGSAWRVHEETRMGHLGLTMAKVSAAVVTNAGQSPAVGPTGQCDLQRWQPDWVAISHTRRRIAIIDLCRPSDVHEDQLKAAALLKQNRYQPLIGALEFYVQQGWVVHVFPWVVGIRGLVHPPHICALLQFLEVPRKHWLPIVESTVLASVQAFYFLHRVRFGGLSKGDLLGSSQAHIGLEEDSDSSDLDDASTVGGSCRRKQSRGPDTGALPQCVTRQRSDTSCMMLECNPSNPSAISVTGSNPPLPCLNVAETCPAGQNTAPRYPASCKIPSPHRRPAGSSRRVRPPLILRPSCRGGGRQANQHCNQGALTCLGNRQRILRGTVNARYDIDDPQSYVSQGRKRKVPDQSAVLWDRWRAMDGKKRRRT